MPATRCQRSYGVTGLYLGALCHVEGWRRRSHEVQVLAAASTPIVVFGLHDVLINNGRLPWGNGHLLHYAAAGVLLARSLTAVERMNEEMNERVLRDTGIRLVWRPGEPEAVARFGPAEILQLMRLLDEATTNVIRHARASEMTIAYSHGPEGLRIEVRDNGTGGARENGPGYGLRNMRHRATSLGGTLVIDSSAAGTTVSVLIPGT